MLMPECIELCVGMFTRKAADSFTYLTPGCIHSLTHVKDSN